MSIHTLLTLLWLLLSSNLLLLPTLLWVQYLPPFILIGKLQDESDSKFLPSKLYQWPSSLESLAPMNLSSNTDHSKQYRSTWMFLPSSNIWGQRSLHRLEYPAECKPPIRVVSYPLLVPRTAPAHPSLLRLIPFNKVLQSHVLHFLPVPRCFWLFTFLDLAKNLGLRIGLSCSFPMNPPHDLRLGSISLVHLSNS